MFASCCTTQWLHHAVGMSQGDIMLSSIPMYAASILNGVFIACLMSGVPWVLTKKFSPIDVLDKIDQFNATIYHAAGPMIIMTLNHEDFPQHNLSI